MLFPTLTGFALHRAYWVWGGSLEVFCFISASVLSVYFPAGADEAGPCQKSRQETGAGGECAVHHQPCPPVDPAVAVRCSLGV